MAEEHIIDMDELVSSRLIRSDYHRLRSDIRKNEKNHFQINKIDDQIYDKKAYEPEIVSIGPYHHGTPALGVMQKMKWHYLDYILNSNREAKLSILIRTIKEIEEKVKACYADAINLEKYLFRRMLLIDGCFILRLLHGLEELVPPSYYANTESIQNNSETENSQENSFAQEHLYNNLLSRDLLLIENQIPFFVVTKIHEVITGGNISSEVLVKNVIESVEEMIGCYPIALRESERPTEFHHLLHLCHMYFRPTKKNIQFSENNGLLWQQNCHRRRASEYHHVGIELKKRECSREDPHSLLDIQFCNGIMVIPGLTIDPNTYSLFKNLIAFEQACPQMGSYVTAYAIFLSCFISMPDDVTLLTTRGIIEHQLNSDADVSTFFRELCEGFVFDFNSYNYLKSLCQVMEAHYQSQKPRFRQWICTIASKISHRAGNNESDLTEMLPPEQFV